MHHRQITRDESLYPNAGAFIPERFLGPTMSQFTTEDGKLPLDPAAYVFGYGRRWSILFGIQCKSTYCSKYTRIVILRFVLAMDFADQLVLVTLLATTRILPEKDPEGNDIMLTLEYTGTLVR